MSMMQINGYHLYVERYGKHNQTPIIFLHGGPGDGCMLLSGLAQTLSDTYDCVCFDQMGCGRSEKIPEDTPFGMDEHTDMIEALRQALGFDKVILYGHGYGGMLACLYAKRYPESVLGIIYDCPSFNFIASVKSLAQFLFREVFIYKDKKSSAYLQCTHILDTVYQDGDIVCVKDVQQMLRYIENTGIRFYLHKKNANFFSALFNSLVAEDINSKEKEALFMRKLTDDGKLCCDMTGLLSQNKQPSLLLVGKYDPICSLEQRRAYIENAENGELVILENSGSFPHLEEPEQHVYSVEEFITNITCCSYEDQQP